MATSAAQKGSKNYPEHGRVIGVQTRTKSPGMDLRPGGGLTLTIRRGSYRIETKDAFYEFEEHSRHPTLPLNQEISFRIKGGNAYVELAKGKEKKYKIIGEGSRSAR